MPYFKNIYTNTKEILYFPLEYSMDFIKKNGENCYNEIYEWCWDTEIMEIMLSVEDYIDIAELNYNSIIIDSSRYKEYLTLLRDINLAYHPKRSKYKIQELFDKVCGSSMIDMTTLRDILIVIRYHLEQGLKIRTSYLPVTNLLRNFVLKVYFKLIDIYQKDIENEEEYVKIFLEMLLYLIKKILNLKDIMFSIEESYFIYSEHFLPFYQKSKFAILTKEISQKSFSRKLKLFSKGDNNTNSIVRIENNRALYQKNLIDSFIQYSILRKEYDIELNKILLKKENSIFKYSYFLQYLRSEEKEMISRVIKNFIDDLYSFRVHLLVYSMVFKILLINNLWNEKEGFYIKKVKDELARNDIDFKSIPSFERKIILIVYLLIGLFILDIQSSKKEKQYFNFLIGVAFGNSSVPEIVKVFKNVNLNVYGVEKIVENFIQEFLISEQIFELEKNNKYNEIAKLFKESLENRSDIDISNKVYQLLWKDFRTIFPSKTKFPRNSSLEGAVRTLLKDIDVANFPKYNTASIII